MSTGEKPAHILGRQGQETDAMQNARLNFAADPVFAHLATLSTAGAISNIEWVVDEGRKGQQKLVAVHHREGKRDTRRRGTPTQSSAQWNLDDGVVLRGRLLFSEEKYNSDRRIFPYSIDSSLTSRGTSTYSVRQLKSSEVGLSRSAMAVYGVPLLRVGILATHTADLFTKPNVETFNETANPNDFRPLLKLLEKTADMEFPDDAMEPAGTLLTRTRPTVATITTLPTAHFAFHEGLGVPESYITRARNNFTVLANYMELPYALPAPEVTE